MTAVEYLFKNMTLYVAYENADTFNKLYEIALEMEKQQIEKAKKEGYNFATSEAIKEIYKNYNQ